MRDSGLPDAQTSDSQLNELQVLSTLQKKMIAQLSGNSRERNEKFYFFGPRNPKNSERLASTSIFDFGCPSINAINAKLNKREKAKLQLKQLYLDEFSRNLDEGRFDLIFSNIRTRLSEKVLFPELAVTYALVYEQLEFYDRSLFWVDLLFRRFPLDEFLIVKKGRLLTRVGRMRELEAHLEYARNEMGHETQRLEMMVVKGEFYMLTDQRKRALEIWSVLLKKGPQNATLLINLAHYHIFCLGDLATGRYYFDLVSQRMSSARLQIVDPFYLFKFERCRTYLRECTASELETLARPKTSQITLSHKLKEIDRSCLCEIAELKQIQLKSNYGEELQSRIHENKSIADFLKGFEEECAATYAVSKMILSEELEVAFKEHASTAFIALLLRLIPFAGASLTEIVSKFAWPETRELLRECAQQVILFSSTSTRFAQKSKSLVRQLVSRANFTRILADVEKEPYEQKFGIIHEKLSFLKKSKSNAHLLGIALAETLFDRCIFPKQSQFISHGVVSDLLAQWLEFGDLASSLPPERVVKCPSHACFYGGFLRMSQMILDAAQACLVSDSLEDGRLAFLKRFNELKDKVSIVYVDRAKHILSLFGNQARLLQVVEGAFHACLGNENKIGSNVQEIVENMGELKFKTRVFVKSVQSYWAKKKLTPYKPFLDLFAKETDYEIKAGAMCCFHVMSGVDYEKLLNIAPVTVLVNGLNQLQFERKGFFSRFKEVYVNHKSREFEPVIRS